MCANTKSGDAELIRHSLDGDDDAFTLLLAKYKPRVLSYVVSRVDSAEDVQDIVQEIFLAAYLSLEKLEDYGKFLNWLYGIAFRIIAAKHRESLKHISYASDSDGFDETMALEEAAVTAYRVNRQRGLSDERVKMSRRAISQLPESQREVMQLHYVDDLSHKAIAQRLGITEVAVNSRLQRARENVKRLVCEAEVKLDDAIAQRPDLD